jgi:hypothetical protein
LSFYEGRLDEGELVAVRAKGSWRTAAEHGRTSGYRQRPKQLVLAAPLTLSDRPFEPPVETSSAESA